VGLAVVVHLELALEHQGEVLDKEAHQVLERHLPHQVDLERVVVVVLEHLVQQILLAIMPLKEPVDC